MPVPSLSLIVPTRERAATLGSTLATALDQKCQEYEVIVSDNASTDRTAEVVHEFDDSRLRYVNTGKRLSMCGNYEFALSHACGDYVIFVGDDDAVVPNAIDRLISQMRPASERRAYMWPLHIYDWPVGGRTGRVAYLAPNREPSELLLKPKARDVVRRGGWKYYELPSPYHAAIPRLVLDDIRASTGRVFHSTQPDVFTAMAIPAFANRALNLGTPITFNGRSASSNGLGFVDKSAQANIQRFLREYGNYPFHPSLYPGVAASANMIPDAILRARDLFPDLYRDSEFSYEAMWAFSCRHRFVSHLEVLRSVGRIRQYHPFRVNTFLQYALLHEGAALRRQLLNLATPTARLDRYARNNIREFAGAIAAEAAQAQQAVAHVAGR